MNWSNKDRICELFIPLVFLLSLSGCSELDFLSASFTSTDSFNKSSENPDVRYKGDNKEFSNKVGLIAPELIAMVEEKTGVRFMQNPIIYICDTKKCIKEYTGHSFEPRASSNKRGVFLSTKLIGKIEETRYILPHELTHVLSVENINILFQAIPPAWFDEGLATFIADGAGAEKVSKQQAIESIRDGKYFIPNDDGKMLSRRYGDKWNLKPHMFYRQSMMLVEYLYNKDPDSFRKFIGDVFSGKEKFSKLFSKYYGSTPAVVWAEYRNNLNKT